MEYTAICFVFLIAPQFQTLPPQVWTPQEFHPCCQSQGPDLNCHTKWYQCIVDSINWLASCTYPGIALVLIFLTSYHKCHHSQHYKAVIHALKYLYSKSSYGISFCPNACNIFQAFSYFPNHHDKETQTVATLPIPANCNMTAFSDACWNSQVGNIMALPSNSSNFSPSPALSLIWMVAQWSGNLCINIAQCKASAMLK